MPPLRPLRANNSSEKLNIVQSQDYVDRIVDKTAYKEAINEKLNKWSHYDTNINNNLVE